MYHMLFKVIKHSSQLISLSGDRPKIIILENRYIKKGEIKLTYIFPVTGTVRVKNAQRKLT